SVRRPLQAASVGQRARIRGLRPDSSVGEGVSPCRRPGQVPRLGRLPARARLTSAVVNLGQYVQRWTQEGQHVLLHVRDTEGEMKAVEAAARALESGGLSART